MDKDVCVKHEKIFNFLMDRHRADSSLFFTPRKINNQNRLEQGYWFIGNNNYLQVSFWDGMDWREKIHNISFVVSAEGESFIEISAQDSAEKAQFAQIVVDKLGGFTQLGDTTKKNKWRKIYPGTDYLAHLKNFIENEKVVIDELIRKHKPEGISFLDKAFHDQYVGRILDFKADPVSRGHVV